MTAKERYEQAWNKYLVLLNRNSKARLAAFLREEHVDCRGMERWMHEKGLSVHVAKQKIRMLHVEAASECRLPDSSSTGSFQLRHLSQSKKKHAINQKKHIINFLFNTLYYNALSKLHQKIQKNSKTFYTCVCRRDKIITRHVVYRLLYFTICLLYA